MGVRENKVEKYLDEQVRLKLGGETRAWKKSNRDGVMDQIVILPPTDELEQTFHPLNGNAVIHFVEVKTIDGDVSPAQNRESRRMRKLSCNVTRVWSYEGVDAYIQAVLNNEVLKENYQ